MKNWLNQENKNKNKNNWKNRTVKKKPIKPIKILKNPTGSVRFRFYKQKTKKTEPNRTEPNPNRKKNQKKTRDKPKKPSQTKKRENRAQLEKPSWTDFCPKKPNRTEPKLVGLTRFRFFFNFFFRFGYFYLIKTEPNKKWSSLVYTCFIMKGIYFLKCFKVMNFLLLSRMNIVFKTCCFWFVQIGYMQYAS